MKLACIDFETYYDADCSIRNGGQLYVNHTKFDAYMIGIYGDDGFVWVGPPTEAPWEALKGVDVVAHNRPFEELILDHLKIDRSHFGSLQCTADMSSYHGWGRSLSMAARQGLNLRVSKDVRNEMKGVDYQELTPDKKKDVAEYCLYDCKIGLRLAQKGMDSWPDWERQVSHETTRMCRQGLPMNSERLDEGIVTLEELISKSLDKIPWADEQKGALSTKSWNQFCRESAPDVRPPKSMAKANPDVIKWISEHPEQGEVLEATHILRGANSMYLKLKTMKQQLLPNGRLPFDLKYYGAYPTGRDSGGSDNPENKSFNALNMPKASLYGVNLRHCIEVPSQDRVFHSADFGQIEARVCAYLAGDWAMLDKARDGGDWYEIMARTFGMYKGAGVMAEEKPELRHKMKQMGLGLQFGMGAGKFAATTGEDLEKAASMVRFYRAKNPKLVKLWAQLSRDMKSAAREDDRLYEIGLPSGRSLSYRDVSNKNGLSAVIMRYGKPIRLKYWHGVLIENACQALARDIFMDRVLALAKAGHNTILRVYDEVLIEGDRSDSKRESESINEIMTTSPDWCSDLPLGTDVFQIDRYTK